MYSKVYVLILFWEKMVVLPLTSTLIILLLFSTSSRFHSFSKADVEINIYM